MNIILLGNKYSVSELLIFYLNSVYTIFLTDRTPSWLIDDESWASSAQHDKSVI